MFGQTVFNSLNMQRTIYSKVSNSKKVTQWWRSKHY